MIALPWIDSAEWAADRLELGVNRDERIIAGVLRVVIAHEAIFCSDFDVPMRDIAVNQNGSDRRRIRIVNGKFGEAIRVNEFVSSFGSKRRFGI